MQKPETAEQGYELVEGLIKHQVHKFCTRYGLGHRFDDQLSEAHEHFMNGHAHYMTGKRKNGTPLETTYDQEIRRWVWWGMFDTMRKNLNRNKSAAMEPIGERDFTTARKTETDALEFRESLGSDASYVAQLAMNPPASLAAEIEAKGGEARNTRSSIRKYLKRVAKWSTSRINTAFEEIAENINY